MRYGVSRNKIRFACRVARLGGEVLTKSEAKKLLSEAREDDRLNECLLIHVTGAGDVLCPSAPRAAVLE